MNPPTLLAFASGIASFAMADWLIFWTLRIAALLLIGLIALRFLRRHPASLQHRWLLALLAIPLVLPVLDPIAGHFTSNDRPPLAINWNPGQVATSWDSEFSGSFGPRDLNQAVTSGDATSNGVVFSTWLCMLWIAGAGFILFCICISQLYLCLLERRSSIATTGHLREALEAEIERQQIRQPVRLLLTPDNQPPMTWGIWRCRIALPAEASDWSPARLGTVLRHELAHVRRRDGWLLLGGQIVLALQWWNPLIWRTLRHLRETTEFLCDDYVLRSGGNSSDYAETLLLSSGPRVAVLPVALSDGGRDLKRRITRILDSKVERHPASPYYSLLLTTLLLIIAWPLAQLSGKTKEGVMEIDERLVPTKIADGFDYPVGAPDGKGYYVIRGAEYGVHLGDDWNGNLGGNNDLGNPVYSIADGLVIDSKDYRAGWGNVIIVRHRYRDLDGKIKYVDSLYGHLHERKVNEGDLVRRGQEIGSMGNNRGMYAAHLHLELRQNLDIKVTNRNEFKRTKDNWLLPRSFIRDRRP